MARRRAKDNAEADWARKVRFERDLRRTLGALDAEIAREFERVYRDRGIIIAAERIEPATATVLAEHRKAVARAFSTRLRALMPGANAITDTENAIISVVLSEYMDNEARLQAARITSTTLKNMSKAIEVVGAEAAAAGEVLTQAERAKRAGGLLRRNLKGRAVNIAILETQQAAEAAKLTEAEVLIGREPTVRGGTGEPAPLGKRWDSQGDSIVRPSHLSADSQEVNLEEPFIVGGFQLMYPGDGSLGAPLSEIAGCRCSARYDADEIAEVREGAIAA